MFKHLLKRNDSQFGYVLQKLSRHPQYLSFVFNDYIQECTELNKLVQLAIFTVDLADFYNIESHCLYYLSRTDYSDQFSHDFVNSEISMHLCATKRIMCVMEKLDAN